MSARLFASVGRTKIKKSRILAAEKEMRSMRIKSRTYRAEATYKVNGGKWYGLHVDLLNEIINDP